MIALREALSAAGFTTDRVAEFTGDDPVLRTRYRVGTAGAAALAALGCAVADLHVLRRLPKVLREADFKVTAVIVDEALIEVEAGDTSAQRYAMAFDLGTTTVVATLLDVSTGTPVAVASMLNRQQPFGADVITRISATMMDPETLGRLQQAAAHREVFNQAIDLQESVVVSARSGRCPRGRGRPAPVQRDSRAIGSGLSWSRRAQVGGRMYSALLVAHVA